MILCRVLIFIFTLLTNVICGVVSAYIVKLIDKRHKKDRHSPKHGL